MIQQLTVELTPDFNAWTVDTFLEHIRCAVGAEDRTEVNDKIKRFADMILAEILARYDWPFKKTSGTIVTSSGVAEYSMEADLAYADGRIQSTAGNQLRKVPLDTVRGNLAADDTQGMPRHFALSGESSVLLWPYPDGAYTLSYDFTVLFESFTDLEAADRLPLPVQYQNMLILGTEWLMRQSDHENDATTRNLLATYQKAMTDHIWRLEMAEDHAVTGDTMAER